MNRRDDVWVDCESEKIIGTDGCEVDRIESVKCEREEGAKALLSLSL